MALNKSKNFLQQALEEKHASAAAFFLRSEKESQEWYLGQTGRKEQGAISGALLASSIFDLASVSKLLGTTSMLFTAVAEKKFGFSDPIRKYFPGFPSASVTILDLMGHKSGLPAHIEFFRKYSAFEEGTASLGDQSSLLSWICEAGLPNTGKQVYSDLGFMLLGLLLEKQYGKPLPEIFHEKIATPLKLQNTGYVTLPHAKAEARLFGLLAPQERFVATEICPWRKKTLQGEVHDDNTWALGGYAGHAGLFSTPQEAVILFDHLWSKVQSSEDFMKRELPEPGIFSFGFSTYPGLRPFPGPAFANSYGHTGYTGTSLWFHPTTQTLSILFSNRVHPSRTDDRWITTRLEFHKLVWEELFER